jgi:hypothetical protein
VDLAVVVRVGYTVEYPLVQLALGILMHQAPRRVITEAGVSELLWPKRSLIAGCAQAVDLSRLALWEVLEEAHAAHRPRELRTWVDDMAHGERGREQDVEDKLVKVALAMVELLRQRGFKVSPKTVVTTTPASIAKRVVNRLAQAGVHFQTTQVARDLGIDTYGVRRGTKVMQDRIQKAGRRAKGIRALMAINKDAKALVNTGFRPQAV